MKERPILFSGPMIRAILDGRKTQTRRIIKPQPPEGVELKPYVDLLTNEVLWGWDTEFVSANGGVLEYSDGTVRTIRKMDHEVFPDEVNPYVRRSQIGVQKCQTLKPRYRVGDRLWVKETWTATREYDHLPPTRIHPCGRSRIHYLADGPKPDWAGKWRSSIHMPRWASRITLEVVGVRVERLQDITPEDAIAEGAAHVQVFDGAMLDLRVSNDPVGEFNNLWRQINGPASWGLDPYVRAIEFRRI